MATNWQNDLLITFQMITFYQKLSKRPVYIDICNHMAFAVSDIFLLSDISVQYLCKYNRHPSCRCLNPHNINCRHSWLYIWTIRNIFRRNFRYDPEYLWYHLQFLPVFAIFRSNCRAYWYDDNDIYVCNYLYFIVVFLCTCTAEV